MDPDCLRAAYLTARAALLAERTLDGHWVGELSASALSTATAVAALALVSKHDPAAPPHAVLVARGLEWVRMHQNADGGWGDTILSLSNVSTTMLGRAAFHIAGAASEYAEPLRRSDAWLAERYGSTPAEHAEAIRRRYGRDRTFSVPILMTAALAGLVDWREVPALPFELACLPQSWYRFARLPVVSYALPALIAIGQAIYHHRPPRNPVARLVRRWARGPSLKVLERIQPSSGGYLEAIPLTSFVALSLASSGRADHAVARKGVEFLVQSVRDDGGWPIDSNLATWVTTLSVNALAAAGDLGVLDRQDELRDWLLRQQGKERHPYTGAAPGGWGWTDLPGSVPDVDDTAGALIALAELTPGEEVSDAARGGLRWLLNLQNSNLGWPTFCRGWGKLPFDRSGCDLTAHVLRAIERWRLKSGGYLFGGFWSGLDGPDDANALEWGFDYLEKQQRSDGSWLPLWFGNPHAPDDENPTYGTARVLAAFRDLTRATDRASARRGVAWLLANQNDDGGWGGGRGTPSSIEETALAVEVLIDLAPADAAGPVNAGLVWLVSQVEAGGLATPAPIGFYFAKLWYFERLYPIIFSVAALGRACRTLLPSTDKPSPPVATGAALTRNPPR